MHIVFSYQTQHNNISILLYFTWYQSSRSLWVKTKASALIMVVIGGVDDDEDGDDQDDDVKQQNLEISLRDF